ncbi:MAG: peptide chain release factor N(5)-glutamine methyltransferase [Acidobacteria bacterium]|nr:MAG: peptide chain release factor N(5)-glutamine methyltransferase [Acidobacteriota bacterium]
MLAETLAAARAKLVEAGIRADEATIDVDVLANLREPAPPQLEPRFSEWISRRERREPTAYIVGKREFWGRDFLVTPAVLVPRPETEFIVQESLALTIGVRAPRIADIGTGSGILAVTLAAELPHATVVATDLSSDALVVARENGERLGVAGRTTFVRTSYLDDVDGVFDLIVANPPYVRDSDKSALARDVRHEPDVALFGGPDGLRDVGGVLDAAVAKLKLGGWFVMEFGYGQEDDVRSLVSARPSLRLQRIRDDFQGIARTAIIQRI